MEAYESVGITQLSQESNPGSAHYLFSAALQESATT